MNNFHIQEQTEYSIVCEGCGCQLGPDRDEAAVCKNADLLDWIAVDTPEDGTLNFCRECKEGLRQ